MASLDVVGDPVFATLSMTPGALPSPRMSCAAECWSVQWIGLSLPARTPSWLPLAEEHQPAERTVVGELHAESSR